MVARLNARMVASLDSSVRNVANDWDFAKVYRETVSRFLNGDKTLCMDKLLPAADAYATEVVVPWRAKIEAKLGFR